MPICLISAMAACADGYTVPSRLTEATTGTRRPLVRTPRQIDQDEPLDPRRLELRAGHGDGRAAGLADDRKRRCTDGVRDAEHVARVVAPAVRARAGHLAAAAAAQVDRHELQCVAGEPFGEAVEAAQVRRQTGHAHHRWRIRGTPPPHPKPSGRKRDVGVLVSHGLLRHAGTLPLRVGPSEDSPAMSAERRADAVRPDRRLAIELESLCHRIKRVRFLVPGLPPILPSSAPPYLAAGKYDGSCSPGRVACRLSHQAVPASGSVDRPGRACSPAGGRAPSASTPSLRYWSAWSRRTGALHQFSYGRSRPCLPRPPRPVGGCRRPGPRCALVPAPAPVQGPTAPGAAFSAWRTRQSRGGLRRT